MVVLQSCTDSLRVLAGSSSETFPISSDGTYDVRKTEVEGDILVIEESFIAVNEKAYIDIKQEEIPDAITSPDITSQTDEVSYVCICLLLDIFYQCP